MLFFQIPSGSSCAVFLTKSIHTAWEHWHCSFWAAWQSQSVQASPAAPLPEGGKGQQPLSMAEHSGFLGAKPPLESFSWSWLQLNGFSESLAFAALGLSPSCSSLALFPCFALGLSSLSCPFQPPFPLPFWHCPASDPRDFSGHSRPFSLVTLESVQVWVVRLRLPRSAAPLVQLAALPEQ